MASPIIEIETTELLEIDMAEESLFKEYYKLQYDRIAQHEGRRMQFSNIVIDWVKKVSRAIIVYDYDEDN